MKEYKLYATAKKTAKENNLRLSTGRFCSENYYYDLEIFNDISLDDDVKEMIIQDMMEHQVMFFDQPLPGVIHYDKYTSYITNIKTHAYRIFNTDTWKRTMVIIKPIEVNIIKQHLDSIYDQYYKTDETYERKVYQYDHRDELEYTKEVHL